MPGGSGPFTDPVKITALVQCQIGAEQHDQREDHGFHAGAGSTWTVNAR